MIKAKTLTVFLVLTLIPTGCANGNKKYIINILNQIEYIQLVKMNETEDDSYVSINEDDLTKLKREFSMITNVNEYSTTYDPFKTFKDDYRAMFVGYDKRSIEILYSIKNSSLIIRKTDIYTDIQKKKYPQITVIEFSITKESSSIIQKYENQLPKQGRFYTSWPLP